MMIVKPFILPVEAISTGFSFFLEQEINKSEVKKTVNKIFFIVFVLDLNIGLNLLT
jgi:hypothetical protein